MKFEGKGSISSTVGQYGVASCGVVKAQWTPSSSSDSLHARLYDIDGEVIAKAVYGKEPSDSDSLSLCPDNHHLHMIDLGLGVRWACCNAHPSQRTTEDIMCGGNNNKRCV